MLIIVQILIAVLVFGLLIIVHELGHFAAAKATGIKERFFHSPPRIIGKKISKTDFHPRLPIGGACIMEGEDEDSHDTRVYKKPIYARF